MNEPTGIKRAINAAWEKLPEVLTAAVVALVVFSFGMWIDTRDIKHELADILVEQAIPRLCERIGSCPGGTLGARNDAADLKALTSGMREMMNERGKRIDNLEQQVFELRNKPSARADPFTGTMGRELDDRIKQLEQTK
jgi:hypothetical protein